MQKTSPGSSSLRGEDLDKRVVSIKKAVELTGFSRWTFYKMIRQGKLTKHQVYTSLAISMAEFEAVTEVK